MPYPDSPPDGLEMERMRSHRLDDRLVQLLLSGFLSSELRDRGVTHISDEDLTEVLERYIEGVNTMLEKAVGIQAVINEWRNRQ
jgi:hypothetical protein